MEIREQFIEKFKNLTFTHPLSKDSLQRLQKQKCVSYAMLNSPTANLSGKYYKKWVYSGKTLKAEQQPINSSYYKTQKQIKTMKNETDLRDVPFIKLIKRAEWETVSIMLENSQNKDSSLLRQLSCIQFPKLTRLVLIGNNMNSIELLQTMQFPNLQDLSLSFNKITNVKSLQKLNCKYIKYIDVRANFLNSHKTFQGLTRINAPNLMQASLQMQSTNNFLHDIQRHINLNQQNNEITELPIFLKQHKYDELNQNSAVATMLSRYYNELSRRHFDIEQILYDDDKKFIQIFDYLLRQAIDSQQYKFLLKTNSLKQDIFCASIHLNIISSRGPHKYSPYQYFIDYGTNIDKFCQYYEKYLQKQNQYESYYSRQFGCPCCSGICWVCQQYRCVCEDIYEEKSHDKKVNKRGKIFVNKIYQL